MATKKGTPVPEEPVEEVAVTDDTAALKAKLEKLQAENEQLRRDSVAAYSAAGARTDYERVKEACEEAAKAGKDAWGIEISIRAPRRPAKEDPYYWLSVNGQSVQIPANDKYFPMKLPFADALVNMIAAEWFANDYSDSIEEYDPIHNPHRD